MTYNPSHDWFPPVERAPVQAIRLIRGRVLSERVLGPILEAVPDGTLVLNMERQIVAANRAILELFALNEEELVGKRPGEVLKCIHAGEGFDGCTTGVSCNMCGAAMTILQSQTTDSRAENECRMTIDHGGLSCLDLHVTATPVRIGGTRLTVCVLKDVSAEKRRRVLEKVFFHDLMNTVHGIHGLAGILSSAADGDPEEEENCRGWLMSLSEKLIGEIKHQRKLVDAEKGEFMPETEIVEVRSLMRDVHALYLNHSVANERRLVLGEVPEKVLLSDSAILRRILGNLVKNALEAIRPGESVTMYASGGEGEISFHVHNPGVMPREVQLQLFQRSFSTKAETGRGIGTYSVKLFGERYLKGKVDFISREPEGTVFTLTLPV